MLAAAGLPYECTLQSAKHTPPSHVRWKQQNRTGTTKLHQTLHSPEGFLNDVTRGGAKPHNPGYNSLTRRGGESIIGPHVVQQDWEWIEGAEAAPYQQQRHCQYHGDYWTSAKCARRHVPHGNNRRQPKLVKREIKSTSSASTSRQSSQSRPLFRIPKLLSPQSSSQSNFHPLSRVYSLTAESLSVAIELQVALSSLVSARSSFRI